MSHWTQGSAQVLSLMALIVFGNVHHLLSSSLFFGCAGKSLPLSLQRHLALFKYPPPPKKKRMRAPLS